MKTCPRCGKDYSEYPAISRVDNKTEICPSCGTEEAQIKAGIISPTDVDTKFAEKLKGRDDHGSNSGDEDSGAGKEGQEQRVPVDR